MRRRTKIILIVGIIIAVIASVILAIDIFGSLWKVAEAWLGFSYFDFGGGGSGGGGASGKW